MPNALRDLQRDHGLMAQTPGYPGYASNALAELFPSPTHFIEALGIPGLSDAASLAIGIKDRNALAMLAALPLIPAGIAGARKLRRPVNSAGKEISPTAYELAHEQARINAALPVEQGGLGLPANNTAMDRARAMGYRQDLYHGTSATDDFTQFNTLDVFMTGNRRQASGWANNASLGGEGEYPRVMPLMTKARKGNTENISQDIYDAINESGDVEEGLEAGISRAMAKNKRFTEFGHPNVYGSGEHRVVSSIFPRNGDIRSRFAAFDPMLRNSPNILASMAALASPLGAYYLRDPREQD